MTQQKKRKAPLLHKEIAKVIKEQEEEDEEIPYSKVKFVLRFKFRIPKEHFGSIIDEFCKFGLLERLDKRTFKCLS